MTNAGVTSKKPECRRDAGAALPPKKTEFFRGGSIFCLSVGYNDGRKKWLDPMVSKSVQESQKFNGEDKR